jgi:uncharacterized oligopeptide transporter (OPT) family protein
MTPKATLIALQVCGVVLVLCGLGFMLLADGRPLWFLVGGCQMLAGAGMAITARMRRRYLHPRGSREG